MRYAVVIEKAGDVCSAYIPHLPGNIATRTTVGSERPESIESRSTDCFIPQT